MIARIQGKLEQKLEYSLIVNVNGVGYEVMVPVCIMSKISEHVAPDGTITLTTYHYLQITPSSATPVLIGFVSDVERDFFLEFISVSGIGPRAAVKALNKPISQIAQAIAAGDVNFLKTLPGIGLQRAKEVVAKLQNKVGKFALMREGAVAVEPKPLTEDFQEDALEVLLQLQYKKPEAVAMIQKAIERSKGIATTEELLNEIYKQRITA